MSAALLVSSCATGAGSGAYAGGSLGSILGSAIGVLQADRGAATSEPLSVWLAVRL